MESMHEVMAQIPCVVNLTWTWLAFRSLVLSGSARHGTGRMAKRSEKDGMALLQVCHALTAFEEERYH